MSSVGKFKKVKSKKKYFWICPSLRLFLRYFSELDNLEVLSRVTAFHRTKLNAVFCIILCDPDVITDLLLLRHQQGTLKVKQNHLASTPLFTFHI